MQQDMMRPKSAMYYVNSIEEISTDLASLIDRTKDSNSDIADVVSVIFPWALESISSIFLDTRLGCLGETPSTDGLALVAASEVVLGHHCYQHHPSNFNKPSSTKTKLPSSSPLPSPKTSLSPSTSPLLPGRDMFKLVTRPPLWKYLPLPEFRRFDAASEKILGIARSHVERAAARLQEGQQGQGRGHSMLAKLLVSSGGDLDIPAMMAVDSMMAGIDTTGTTAAFLLYHLASHRSLNI